MQGIWTHPLAKCEKYNYILHGFESIIDARYTCTMNDSAIKKQ